MHEGKLSPSGDLSLEVIRPSGRLSVGTDILDAHPDSVRWPASTHGWQDVLAHGFPQLGQPEHVRLWRRSNMRNLWRGWRRVLTARALKLPVHYGALWLSVFRADGTIDDLGLASLRVVTDDGCEDIVDAFQNLFELENHKYHGLGTGTNSESVTDAALQTELSTQYNPNSTRATGSTTESTAQVYRTVGTNTVDGSAAVTEHGVFSQAATGGGRLLDRSVFAVVNLSSGDSLQSTYDLSLTSGS